MSNAYNVSRPNDGFDSWYGDVREAYAVLSGGKRPPFDLNGALEYYDEAVRPQEYAQELFDKAQMYSLPPALGDVAQGVRVENPPTLTMKQALYSWVLSRKVVTDFRVKVGYNNQYYRHKMDLDEAKIARTEELLADAMERLATRSRELDYATAKVYWLGLELNKTLIR